MNLDLLIEKLQNEKDRLLYDRDIEAVILSQVWDKLIGILEEMRDENCQD